MNVAQIKFVKYFEVGKRYPEVYLKLDQLSMRELLEVHYFRRRAP